MVGHSLGGIVVQICAADYGKDLAGMVDASNGNSMQNINGKLAKMREFSQGHPVPGPRSTVTPADALSPEGKHGIEDAIAKYDFMRPAIEPPYGKLPAEIQKLQLWATSQPKHWVATQDEYFGEEGETLYEWSNKSQYPLGDTALIVLWRGKDLEGYHMDIQNQLKHLSRQSKLIVVKEAGHQIRLDAPQAVIDAVKNVVSSARQPANK